jgi:flavin reductase (DIM6/NTAB) family NADH-FMN oxidoreductase RutF
MSQPPLAPRIPAADLRGAAGHLAGTVAIVIAAAPGGAHASTASSASVVSVDPPLLAVSFAAGGRMAAALAAGRFTVSALREEDQALARRLADPARPPGLDGLAGAALVTDVPGAPRLAGAAAWFACRVIQPVPVGDHTCFVAEILACGRDPGARPLLHYRGRYHALGEALSPASWSAAAFEELAAVW